MTPCSDVIFGLSTIVPLSYEGQDDVALAVDQVFYYIMAQYYPQRLANTYLILIYVWCTWLHHKALGCVPTQGITTFPPLPPVPPDCCPALEQTTAVGAFQDGVMTFTYDNDTCRTSVVALCSQADPLINVFAAIVANGQFFLDIAPNSVSFPGTCNTTDQTWLFVSMSDHRVSGLPAVRLISRETQSLTALVHPVVVEAHDVSGPPDFRHLGVCGRISDF